MPTNGNRFRLTRDEKLQIMLSPEEREAVDDFRFSHRMPTRAAAVRELLRHGLASHGMNAKPNVHEKSKNFGVLKPGRGD